ncbi:hypothetical protein HaLaN_14441, partial [Haematococcus lacustris]
MPVHDGKNPMKLRTATLTRADRWMLSPGGPIGTAGLGAGGGCGVGLGLGWGYGAAWGSKYL